MTRDEEMKWAEIYLAALEGGELTDRADIIEALNLKWFRICALYKIKDKDGKTRVFTPNSAQRERYRLGHVRDIILKARQLGFTTLEMIDALDDCLFTENFSAGCICHKLEDAQDIFRNKVQFAYENISQAWLAIFKVIGLKFPHPVGDRSGGYVFSNGSSIKVSTSYRGGTLQRLHVSEFGNICRRYPDKAKEIVTGAFEAVGLGNKITLESTAEGREGYFFEYCETAQHLQEQGRKPTVMDWQFHFYPWWGETAYVLDPAGVIIPQRLNEYFEKLEQKHGISLTREQQAWYAKKSEVLHDDMQREYPSTPEEAFAQSVEGAYYASQMTWLRENGHITTKVHYNPSLPVYTAWDLGMDDAMSIWFAQVVGREIHLIDYHEDSGEGMEHYADVLHKKGYRYAAHFGPHDLSVREIGTGTSRMDTARKFGIPFQDPIPRISNQAEGVQAVRSFLPACWFDEEACHQGVLCLDSYRKEWNDKLGVYRDSPRHDWASHGAKSFETLARANILGFATKGVMTKPVAKRNAWAAHT